MKITFEGRTWEFRQEVITIKQAMAIHFAYGLTIRGLLEGIQQLDVRAIQCDYWLMLQQNGIEKPITECDFDPLDFMAAMGEARDAEEAAEKAAREAAKAAEAQAVVPTSPPPDGQAWSGHGYQTDTPLGHVVPAERPLPPGTGY